MKKDVIAPTVLSTWGAAIITRTMALNKFIEKFGCLGAWEDVDISKYSNVINLARIITKYWFPKYIFLNLKNKRTKKLDNKHFRN